MKYIDETRKILGFYYSEFHEEAIGIGFSILDREHHRILTSQTDVKWAKNVSAINTEHDPYVKMIILSQGNKIITSNTCPYTLYTSLVQNEITKRKENGTHNPVLLIRRINEKISTIFSIYYKNSVTGVNEPCKVKIGNINQLISDKICINLLKRNDEINKSNAEQEAQPILLTQEQLLEERLKQPAQSHKENPFEVVAF